MLESAIAFIIWGCPGPLLVRFHSDPVILALARYFFSGLFFLLLWLGFRVFGGGEKRARLPWTDRALWISGTIILARNIFYMLSFAAGPAAVAGLIYGYAPLLIPFFGYFLKMERGKRVSNLYWLSLFVSFVGNYAIFRGLHQESVPIGSAVLLASGAAICYVLTPVFSYHLQEKGLRPSEIVGAQSVVASIVSVPCVLLFLSLGMLKFTDLGQVHRTVGLAAVLAVFFTIFPFYLWYSGIRNSGLKRVTPMGFLEPLTSSVLSFYVLGDAKPSPPVVFGLVALATGFGIAIADSLLDSSAVQADPSTF
jgi:drug/metabolite transporter (DMT)-like permease